MDTKQKQLALGATVTLLAIGGYYLFSKMRSAAGGGEKESNDKE